MPRKKTSAPQRLEEHQRRSQAWNLGENSEPANVGNENRQHASNGNGSQENLRSWADLINDAGEEDYNSDEDADFNPDAFGDRPPEEKRAKKSTGIQAGKEALSPELQLLVDTSKFCVSVSTEKKEGEWQAKLGQFQFKFLDTTGAEESLFDDVPSNEFWVYLSRVPDMSFVYFRPDRYFKLTDVPNLKLLEAFEVGTVGAKRRNMTLVFNSFDMGVLTLDVKVFESTLFQWHHPSDVVAKVPHCVRRTLDFFFGLNTNLKLSGKTSYIELKETHGFFHLDIRFPQVTAL